MGVRLLKCYGDCGNKYEREQLVKFGGQNHCKPCAEKKEKDKKDREILYKQYKQSIKYLIPMVKC